MRAISILAPLFASILLAACGSSGSARGTTTTPASPPPSQPAVEHTPESVCRRLAETASRCSEIGFGRVEMRRCIRSFEEAARTKFGQDLLKTGGQCLTANTGCEQIYQCLQVVTGGDQPLRACDEDPGAGQRVGIPRAEWERRNGAGVAAFRDAKSTKTAPIEMCGVPAANEWLTTLSCNDGSQPLRDRAGAEDARKGNVGPGGRCGSFVDHYVVACPEAAYEIFIDAYVCALPDP